MDVAHEILVAMFSKIRQLQEDLRLNDLAPDTIPVPVDLLHTAVERRYELKIEIKRVHSPANFLRGMLLRSNGSAKILVRADQPEEWLRFTVAKELCQIMLAEPEDWSVDVVQNIGRLMHSISLDLNGSTHMPDRSTISDRLSELCAMECLYPCEFHEPDFASLRERRTTHGKLALRFKVPGAILAWAHQEDYRTVVRACRGS